MLIFKFSLHFLSSYVALKIVKSAPHFTDTAKDEIQLLKSIRNGDPSDPKRNKTVQMLNDFKITGPNGTHICMVFEVLGHNLLKLILKSNYRGIPLKNVKSIIRQVLEGLDYLHTKCKIIHTDIKPENVLVCINEVLITKLAIEASEMHAMGCKLPYSLISTAPQEFNEPPSNSKISRNKKKKMKKKAKMQMDLIRQQIEHLHQQDFAVVNGEATATKGKPLDGDLSPLINGGKDDDDDSGGEDKLNDSEQSNPNNN